MDSFDFPKDVIVLSVIIFALICTMIAVVVIFYNYQQEKYVKANSTALKQISILSYKYSFYEIESFYTHSKHQKSLAAFKHFNYNNELISFVSSYKYTLKEEIKKASENETNYKKYIDEFNEICNTQITVWNSKRKKRIEEKLIDNSRMSPVCSIGVKIRNIYISPGGRSQHSDCCIFSQSDIIDAFDKIKEQELFADLKKRERSKMNDSLRYDILKRDGFRCTICGASAEEGAKLHVDHIVPIAKGGKTMADNLRTLCSSCNFGKSDKYDPNGVN